MSHQLGWVLYLSCLAIALGWTLFFGFVVAGKARLAYSLLLGKTRRYLLSLVSLHWCFMG